jgi:capsular polysaccharide biosynthesis protein
MTDNDQGARGEAVGDTGEVTFAEIVAFFSRNWKLIFGAALGVGLVTAAIVLLFIAHAFEAAATLVVIPSKFASELKPSILTVQGYRTLLESDAIIAETKRRLVEKGVLKPSDSLTLGRNIETRIFVSRRVDEAPLAPMLQAVARDNTAEAAATIANTWAQVFVERTRELMAGTTSSTVQFIDAQYPIARDRTTQLEDERVTAVNGLQKRFDDAATGWDARVTAFKNETADLVGAYKAETQGLIEEFRSTHNLETRKLQLDALRKAYSDLQGAQAQVSAQLQEKQLQLDATKKQLAATPQFVTLRKAITDDALWRAVEGGRDAPPNWKALQDRALETQELDPVYTELARRVAQLESDVNALTPRAAQLAERLGEISAEAAKMDLSVSTDESALEKLSQERDAGLAKLREDRTNRVTELMRERQADLDAIKREWDTKTAQMDRDIAQQRDLLAELTKNYNQAALAKGQQGMEDVRIGAPAAPPDHPLARGGVVKTLVGLFVGGCLGIGVALVREVRQTPGAPTSRIERQEA